MYKTGMKRNYPAYVPGCVHGALADAGVIEDPFKSMNLLSMNSLLEVGWLYEKVFVAEELSSYHRVTLHFDGLTAAAEIILNGHSVGVIDRCFHPVDFDVKKWVNAGKNTLCVKFSPVKQSKAGASQSIVVEEGSLLYAQSFGLWGDVSLRAYSSVMITNVRVDTLLKSSTAAEVMVQVESERLTDDDTLELMARLCYKGNILCETRVPYKHPRHDLKLEIKNPQLWWPASMGDQPLYEVTLDILQGRTCLEHTSRRIGLRSFEVRNEKLDNCSVKRFYVNGKPLLLKGAEWIPADIFVARPTRVEYAHLVKSAVIANINLLRVSGAGIYEHDCFYNLCDEYGVCVWQDVINKDDDEESMENAMAYAMNRLRHHPSLVIWFGGELPPKSAEKIAQTPGLSGSHLVWLDQLPSEVALVNYGGDNPSIPGWPGPREISRYLHPSQRNVGHPVARFHHSSLTEIKNVLSGFLDNFRMPTSFDSALWLSQIQQGLNVKWMIEKLRMQSAGSTGFIFRRLNDGWPCCAPSSLDYYGVWKALHYMTRRYYAQLSVCGLYDQTSGQVQVFAFNDNSELFKGEVCWSVSLMDGSIVSEGSRKLSIAATARSRPLKIKVADLINQHSADQMVMWVYLIDEQGNKVSWNVVLFCKPYELSLQPARMRAEIRKHDENSYVVTLTSQTPAMWAWVSLEELDAVYSDNFFCMEPAKPFSVRIIPKQRIKLDDFRQRFRIGSLRDTWQEKGMLMQMRASPKKR